jgi:hypothetical protein
MNKMDKMKKGKTAQSNKTPELEGNDWRYENEPYPEPFGII